MSARPTPAVALGPGLDQACRFLKALASPNRLMLLCLLEDGEASVADMAAALGLRQPTVSQHLGRLRAEGLVATRRDAQTVYYRLADDTVRRIIEVLHQAYCS